MKLCYYCFRSFLVISFITTIGYGQSTTLPPAAQEAINKGIIAAKIPDYILAIRYFEEARKIAPVSSEVFFNLGLAESKIPGRELRAICWFGAYLTANPTAHNAAAVKEQMDMLFIKNQSNLSGLIRSLQDAAGSTSSYKSYSLGQVALLWAKTGDISTALQVANQLLSIDRKNWDYILQEIGRIQIATSTRQAEARDLTGALNTLSSVLKTGEIMDEGNSKNYIYYSIANAFWEIARLQREIGDFDDANKTLGSAQMATDICKNEGSKYYMQSLILSSQVTIIDEQIKKNDIAAAQTGLTSVLKTLEPLPKSKLQTELYYVILVQLKLNDIPGAQKNAALITEGRLKISAGWAIATAQAKAADIPAAQITAALILDTIQKSYAEAIIAEAQIKAKDISGAKKTLALAQDLANLIKDAFDKSCALEFIAEVQVKAGDLSGAKTNIISAKEAAELIQGIFQKCLALRNIATGQFKMGHMADAKAGFVNAKKVAEDIPDLWTRCFAHTVIAEHQINTGDTAGAKTTIAMAQKATELAEDTVLYNRMWRDIFKVQQQAGITNYLKPSHKLVLAKQLKDQRPERISEWINKLDYSKNYPEVGLNRDPFLDITGFLQSIPASDPNKYFDKLKSMADEIVAAQNVIEKMMKKEL